MLKLWENELLKEKKKYKINKKERYFSQKCQDIHYLMNLKTERVSPTILSYSTASCVL